MASQGLPPGTDPNIDFANLYKVPNYAKAHGTLMGTAFVVVYPLGAILVRLLHTRKVVWIHAACQLTGWVLMIAGMSLGIEMGTILDLEGKNAHTILGTIVVVGLLLQPVFGFIHHWRYLKKQRRGKWTIMHIWYGRLLIVLGMINGGLGLHLAATDGGQAFSKTGMIVYAVLAGISGVTFLSVAAFATAKGTKKVKEEMAEPVRA